MIRRPRSLEDPKEFSIQNNMQFCQGFDWSSSEEIATKVMTCLHINSITYLKLKVNENCFG